MQGKRLRYFQVNSSVLFCNRAKFLLEHGTLHIFRLCDHSNKDGYFIILSLIALFKLLSYYCKREFSKIVLFDQACNHSYILVGEAFKMQEIKVNDKKTRKKKNF